MGSSLVNLATRTHTMKSRLFAEQGALAETSTTKKGA